MQVSKNYWSYQESIGMSGDLSSFAMKVSAETKCLLYVFPWPSEENRLRFEFHFYRLFLHFTYAVSYPAHRQVLNWNREKKKSLSSLSGHVSNRVKKCWIFLSHKSSYTIKFVVSSSYWATVKKKWRSRCKKKLQLRVYVLDKNK